MIEFAFKMIYFPSNMMHSVLKMMNSAPLRSVCEDSGEAAFCINNDELCIKNDELCIRNDEFCIKNDELCIKNDEFCITHYGLCINKCWICI